MTKFSNKLKKNLFLDHFGTIFPILGAKFFFPENPSLSRTTSHGILAPCQNSEKTCHNSKKMPRQMEGQNDRQALFYRTLPATAREITSFLK